MSDWKPSASINAFFGIVGIFLCAYLIAPAFNAVHLEGFTAQTQSIALLKSVNPVLEHDPYLPLVTQFIYQTRSAVIDGLSLIYEVFPHAGDLAFKGMVLLSFIVLLIASIVFGKRYGNVSPLFGFFALILTQGIPETAFFLNDNIVSAALAVAGLAVISKRGRTIEWLVSGMLLALAIVARFDAVLLLPIVGGVIFYNFKATRERMLACIVFALGAVAVVLGLSIYHGFSPLDTLAIGRRFILVTPNIKTYIFLRVYFLGLIVAPFLLIGFVVNFRSLVTRKSYIGILTFVVYPAGLLLVAPNSTEVRYIFPLLAPLVALHAGRGIHWVYECATGGTGNAAWFARLIAAGALLVALVPPTLVQLRDGPRSMLGRLWSPVSWFEWQESIALGEARSKELVKLLDSGKLEVLVTTHYNDEFFLRLRLMEAGFVPVSTGSRYPGCGGFSLLKKGDSEVAHIRTAPQYLIAPISITSNAALQISTAFDCQPVKAASEVYLTTFGINDYGFKPEIYQSPATSFQEPLVVKFHDTLENILRKTDRTYGILNFRRMEPAQITAMRQGASAYLADHADADSPTGKKMSIGSYMAYYRPTQGPTSQSLLMIHSAILGQPGQ
jgi:hypothetical protein